MIAELGQFFLILTLTIAVAQTFITAMGVRSGDAAVYAYARIGAIAQFVLAAGAFAALSWAFAVSDFSLLVVAQNSHTDKPFIYKLTGVWGNHEGSMLMWTLILTGYSAALAFAGRAIAPKLMAITFAVQSAITAAFVAFLLFTSNPFARLWPAPENGNDLNPLLQDPGLASHPPMLYLGYVGFSVTFSFAVAALIEGRADARWARIVRPWALGAWSFLTLGILLGSSWAYYELGWGGWWAWDPVENASLLPWLAGTAFIHSLRVMEKRDTLKAWTILLALMAFSLSLVGTFLVRSGVITSVHAFAVDPTRGVFILAILVAAIGGALSLYAWRAHTLRPTGTFAEVSRESTLLVNNLFFAAACALVFFGTFYPLFITTVSDETLTVGAPFYNATFNPMMGLLFLLVPVSGMIAWKRGKLKPILRTLAPAGAAGIAAGLIALFAASQGQIAGALGTALAVWVGVGVLLDLRARIKLGEIDLAASWARAKRLPLGIWGMLTSHFGLAILILAVTGISVWKVEDRAFMQPGDTLEIGAYAVTLGAIQHLTAENYEAERGVFQVQRRGEVLGEMSAERRYYPVRSMPTSESGIRSGLLGDLYLTIGDPVAERGWPVHAYIYPLAWWLWIGGVVLALGGMMAMADRGRRRLDAPEKEARRAKAVAAAEGVAE